MDSERWMKEALGMKHLYPKSLSGEGLEGGAPLLGNLEDMLKKDLDMGISLSKVAPLYLRGTWNQEPPHIPGTLNDE